MPELHEQIGALDVALFRKIKSQSKKGDRASLLALHAACAERHARFAYLEIGSHLGGSLQALVRDPRCERIISIDLRPEATPDERGKLIPYRGNSTQRMLDGLAELPGADIAKVATIDADTRSLDAAELPVRPALCFIDGEHTEASCLADARFCRRAIGDDGAIAFHDAPIIHRAIARFLRELRADGLRPVAYPLPASVFVIELGGSALHATAAMRSYVSGPRNTLPALGALLARRPGAPHLLARAWLSPLGAGRARLRVHLRKRWRRRRKHLPKQLARLRHVAARRR